LIQKWIKQGRNEEGGKREEEIERDEREIKIGGKL